MSATRNQFSLRCGASNRRFRIIRTAGAARLLPLVLLFALPAAGKAQFLLATNGGAITITKYKGSGGPVTIPDTISGLPVNRIESFAFSTCANLTSVTIPNNVTRIGDFAFFSCTSLTNVTIGNSVSRIGGGAFSGCSSLPTVTLPNSVTNIGPRAFEHCAGLTNVAIGNGVTSIGDWAFSASTSLAEIHFQGDAPSVVGEHAFHNDKKATVYYLPGTKGWGPTFGSRSTVLGFRSPKPTK